MNNFGGVSGPLSAPKGRRFAADVIDLIIIPIVLGVILGILLLNVPEAIRSVILVIINVIWLIFRDAIYSPGRAMVGLKLVSLTSDKPTLLQSLIRNILLIIPFVLVVGYVVEIIAICVKGDRVADAWAKTRVVQA